MPNPIFTIGHSTHKIDFFTDMLRRNAIDVVADVRSEPYSRMNEDFNQDRLRHSLRQKNINYVFLGRELGARPADECCYTATRQTAYQGTRQGTHQGTRQGTHQGTRQGTHQGKYQESHRGARVDYDKLAATILFQSGIERVIKGAENYRLALMCAEREPLDCHRSILIARILGERGGVVHHINGDGQAVPHAELLAQLVARYFPDELTGLIDQEAKIDAAYRRHGRLIAYRVKIGTDADIHAPLPQASLFDATEMVAA
ncbi:MAG: DUF488 domain-containing protein [Candidatus Symbiobacter sp.]|nr:DUF488 domain-containing protein [Candidatus Symbiobacter sp.]